MRRLVVGVALAIAGIAMTGCGSQSTMTPSARATLQTDVVAVRQAVGLRHVRRAHADLVRLQSDVRKLEADGNLSVPAGAKVVEAASVVQANLILITTTTTTTTTTTPLPPLKPPHKHNHEGRGVG